MRGKGTRWKWWFKKYSEERRGGGEGRKGGEEGEVEESARRGSDSCFRNLVETESGVRNEGRGRIREKKEEVGEMKEDGTESEEGVKIVSVEKCGKRRE